MSDQNSKLPTPKPTEVEWPDDPNVMSREEALRILEIHEGANRGGDRDALHNADAPL